jgi:hypothetical protein
MMDQKGKISFSTIIFILVFVYGGFVAFKFIMVRVDKAQLKTEIIDRIGSSRGADFTLEEGQKIIIQILTAHGILAPDEQVSIEGESAGEDNSGESSENADAPTTPKVAISIKFNENKSNTKFFVKYEVLLDLIFFKNKQDITVEGEVTNVN